MSDSQTILEQEASGEVVFTEVSVLLSDGENSDGQYSLPQHQRCAAHTLNLVAVHDRFFDLTQDLFLIQNVYDVTRVRQDQVPSTLDYVFTYTEEVEQMHYLSPLGSSDHVGLLWKLNCGLSRMQSSSTRKLAYWKADHIEMEKYINGIHWESNLEHKGVEETWNSIKHAYQEAVHKIVPFAKAKSKRKMPSMSKETRKIKEIIQKLLPHPPGGI
jgi:hypothetical protein